MFHFVMENSLKVLPLFCVHVLLCTLLSCNSEKDPAPPKEHKEPLNVIFISVDSLRADHLGCYGYEKETSPTIDRLAREGVLFENTIAESSWTLPTHMSIFSGLTSTVHEVEYNESISLDPARVTLAEVLRDAGYRTRGLWSGNFLHPIYGFGQGFEEDDYEGVIDHSVDDANLKFKGQNFRKMQKEVGRSVRWTLTSQLVSDKAVRFLEEKEDRPFFLFLHYFDCHFAYIPPEEFWRKFDPDYEPASDHEVNFRDIEAGMNERELQHILALYDGEILYTDQHLGRVMDAVKRLGLDDDTLIVFTSDHGQEFLEHGSRGHRVTLYDEVIKVPLIFRLPGIIQGDRRIPEQIRHIDIMPTILDFLALPVPGEVMGESFAGVLKGDSPPPDVKALSRLQFEKEGFFLYSMRTQTDKLIVRWSNYKKDPRVEMYNLQSDPSEQHVQPVSSMEQEDLLKSINREIRLRESLPRVGGNRIELPPEFKKDLEELGYVK